MLKRVTITFLTSGGIVLLFLCCGFGAYLVSSDWLYHTIMGSYDFRTAEYDDMSVQFIEDEYVWLQFGGTSDTQEELPPIHVRFRGEEAYLLAELPEEVAARHGEKHRLKDPEVRYYDTLYFFDTYSPCSLDFKEGLLVGGSLDESGPAISNSPNGPFYKLPIDKETFHAMFGEPNEVTVRYITRP